MATALLAGEAELTESSSRAAEMRARDGGGDNASAAYTPFLAELLPA